MAGRDATSGAGGDGFGHERAPDEWRRADLLRKRREIGLTDAEAAELGRSDCLPSDPDRVKVSDRRDDFPSPAPQGDDLPSPPSPSKVLYYIYVLILLVILVGFLFGGALFEGGEYPVWPGH